jgi:hypothetical protein
MTRATILVLGLLVLAGPLTGAAAAEVSSTEETPELSTTQDHGPCLMPVTPSVDPSNPKNVWHERDEIWRGAEEYVEWRVCQALSPAENAINHGIETAENATGEDLPAFSFPPVDVPSYPGV